MQRFIIFLGGLLLACNVAAAPPINNFWTTPQLVENVPLGLHNGINIANTQLLLDGRKRMYCMPPNVQ